MIPCLIAVEQVSTDSYCGPDVGASVQYILPWFQSENPLQQNEQDRCVPRQPCVTGRTRQPAFCKSQLTLQPARQLYTGRQNEDFKH